MYKVIYMKADYEPWWQFDGWEQTIQSVKEFDDLAEAKKYLEKILTNFENKFPFKAMKKERFWAFWSEDEIEFCEACDEDIQTYHGVVWEEIGQHTKKL
ncbi:DUF1033 family protein [Rummeliibacillus sp. TYF-LIM-RU47]|uniref:DUF1033 family protein n=1 Tax=unclassified Rummeliibacillus TaxID=2622809 RepID=UPI00123A10BF|nr:DUF1033 family protein [Rummeliibacillus sp. TYF-LIM-RU47]